MRRGVPEERKQMVVYNRVIQLVPVST